MQSSSVINLSRRQSITSSSSKPAVSEAQLREKIATSRSERGSVVKALVAIESARKKAGENHSSSVIKPAMYTAVILSELKQRSPELAGRFLEHFQSSLLITKQSNREAIKPAAHQALNKLIVEGSISAADAKKITREAWKTVYKEPSLEKRNLRTATSTSVATAALGSESSGPIKTSVAAAPAGFLWKPIADSSPHGLAILLPPGWTGMISELQILDPQSEQILAKGRDGGVGNGGRQHFRFDNQGSYFPDGCIVRVLMQDGSVRDIVISDTASRIEGR